MSCESLGLFTSVPANLVRQNGLNDTLTFTLDWTTKTIISFQIDFVDKEVQAVKQGLKGNRKKRFLTPNLEQWNSTAYMSGFSEGTLPAFEKQLYDPQGQMQKTKAQVISESDNGPAKEQSFFSKYWWHILIGFMLVQSFMGPADDA